MGRLRALRMCAIGVAALTASELAPSAARAQVAADSTATSLSLDLNLPAFLLQLRDSGRTIRSIPVAVGRSSFPTPIGRYSVDYLIWNPRWTPPDKPWARNEKPQPPGPNNWMGRVKLHVVDLVFLHGSPFVASLGSAASHACVRMKNDDAIFLARTLAERVGVNASHELVDSLIAEPTRTRQMALRPGVPITLRYELAVIRYDSLVVLPDIYPSEAGDQRSFALEALRTLGIDSSAVDRPALAALLRKARRRSAAAPIASLLVPGGEYVLPQSAVMTGSARSKLNGALEAADDDASATQAILGGECHAPPFTSR